MGCTLERQCNEENRVKVWQTLYHQLHTDAHDAREQVDSAQETQVTSIPSGCQLKTEEAGVKEWFCKGKTKGEEHVCRDWPHCMFFNQATDIGNSKMTAGSHDLIAFI
jgi:hypothetical protein